MLAHWISLLGHYMELNHCYCGCISHCCYCRISDVNVICKYELVIKYSGGDLVLKKQKKKQKKKQNSVS